MTEENSVQGSAAGFVFLDRLVGIVTIIFAFVGFIPFILAHMLGVRFLPSSAYIQSVEDISFWFTIGVVVITILLFWFAGTLNRLYIRRMTRIGRKAVPYGAHLVILCMPFLMALAAHQMVAVLYPMARAFVFGQEAVVAFTVEDPQHRYVRGCHSGVKLEGLPFFFNMVCSVPKNVRDYLVTGQPIELEGWGTEDGLFVGSIRIVSASPS